jgi:hypothetical protein
VAAEQDQYAVQVSANRIPLHVSVMQGAELGEEEPPLYGYFDTHAQSCGLQRENYLLRPYRKKKNHCCAQKLIFSLLAFLSNLSYE